MNYHTIKRLAREIDGVTVRDLIALAPQNDPFYVGTNGDIAKAQWFADIWRKFGYVDNVHLRRVHYQLVSQSPPILKPNGKPYENTLADWDFLNLASKCARYLGLVDPGAFVDRRNPEPIIHADYWGDPTPDYWVPGSWGGIDMDIDLPGFPDLPGFSVDGYTTGNLQPYHLEVWVEKTTMNDVLEPLCQRYNVNLVPGAGELSITATLDLVRRAKRADRPCRIFYISDFDPAGYGMPVSVARKLEFFLSHLELDLDIKLEPIALTGEQVDSYSLPRTPIKPTELRRHSFEEIHGRGAVELDALEALYPGLLAQIVENAILRYHDPDLDAKARAARDELERTLAEARQKTIEPFADELTEMGEAFRQAVSEFEAAVSGIQERLNELYPQIVNALESVEVDLDDYPLPEPREAMDFDEPLYDSRRDYLQQLESYKAYKVGTRCDSERP